MTRATNPSNLKLKRKSKDTFAENEIGSDSESISEYENSNSNETISPILDFLLYLTQITILRAWNSRCLFYALL